MGVAVYASALPSQKQKSLGEEHLFQKWISFFGHGAARLSNNP
jgi:hypothetical protein